MRMHKIFTFLLAILLVLNSAIAQKQSIKSQVVDKNGQGVPFAAVGIISKNFGTITFEDGSFELDVNEKYKTDTLIVSAVGFKRKRIPFAQFVRGKMAEITLTERVERLDEVVITDKGWDYVKIGEKKKKTSSELTFYSPKEGTTVGALLNEESAQMFIKEISVGVGRRNLDYIDLRCMLFSVDTNGLPGDQLFGENVLGKVLSEREIVTFKLEEDFWINEPFYVGFEWVITKDQYKKLEEVKSKYPLKWMDDTKDQNPGLRLTINNNKTMKLWDESGELVKEIPLTEQQRDELNARSRANPGVYYQFQTKDSGLKTVSGSYITNKWREYDFHALVSILAAVEPE